MMSTKVISSYYPHGYSIAQGNNLYITSTGSVGYFGVYAGYNATITNEGSVSGALRFEGIVMAAGGLITNGSTTNTGAEIKAFVGVLMKYVSGSVTNFGLIEGVDSFYGFGDGIELNAGGVVRNGSVASRSAVIEGAAGVSAYYGVLDVHNYGLIASAGVNKSGVYLGDGGQVTNGANTDTTAIIQGGNGVFFAPRGAGFVDNYGTITGQAVSGDGVLLGSGGTVINGTGGDRAALIQGAVGVSVEGAVGAVANAGTIRASDGYGVIIDLGGTLTNGSLNNPGALIEGYGGVYLYGATHGSNFGTICGTADGGSGVRLVHGASVTNGAAGHTAGLIEGYVGVRVYYEAAATVTNFGTIIGTGNTAVEFTAATDVLDVGAGSTFVGAVLGAGGALDLLSGTGTITGLFAAGGNVTVSGSMATTTFQNFGTVLVSAGASFTDHGAVKAAAGQTVNDAGILKLSEPVRDTNAGLIETTGTGLLTIAGSLVNTGTLAADGGTLVVKGAVTGAGVAMIGGGTLDLVSSFNEAVTFTGATGVLDMGQSQPYAATITGFSRSGGTSLDFGDIGFVGSTEATFSGTRNSGVLTVTDGTHTAQIKLKGNYTNSTFVASSDGHGGTVVVDSTAKDTVIAPSSSKFIEAMAGLGAPGVVGVIHTAQTWLSGRCTLASPHFATT